MKKAGSRPLDSALVLLKVGDPVESTIYYNEQKFYKGEVVSLVQKNVVEIRRDDGIVVRCSSRLWRKVSGS